MGFVGERTLSSKEFVEECIEFKRAQEAPSRFLRELILGKLQPHQLALFAKDFYHYIEPVIPSIAAWLAATPTLPDRRAYKLIGRNLAGEMGYLKEADHNELYLAFCKRGLDISREEVLDFLPTPGSIGAASAVGYYCRSSFLEGLGGFGLAVEMEVPGSARAGQLLYDAFRKHYHIDERALEFWSIHIGAEEEHGANAQAVLELCGQTREQQALIRRAFRFSVLAHRGMRDCYDRFLDASQP